MSHACLFFFNMPHALPVHPHSQNPIKIKRQIIKKILKKNPHLKRCSLRDYNFFTFFLIIRMKNMLGNNIFGIEILEMVKGSHSLSWG